MTQRMAPCLASWGIAGSLLTACGAPADQSAASFPSEGPATSAPTPTAASTSASPLESTSEPPPAPSPPAPSPQAPPPPAPRPPVPPQPEPQPPAPRPPAPPPPVPGQPALPPPSQPPAPPPPPPQQGSSLPSPVDIPDIFVITGGSWDSDAESYIRSRISEGCGDLGPGCVDYVVVEEPNTEVDWTVDCPILQIRIPRPLYDVDVAGTPHRDDLLTIVINDPCDGVIVSAPPPPPPPPPPPLRHRAGRADA